MRQVAHETPVHLQVVDRKELEVAERRIAGAEVVDGEVHAHRAQIAHELHRLVRIPHHHAFGDFELEDAGFGPGGLEDFRELGYELDRKSTRLNSSHPSISYAVFCLK